MKLNDILNQNFDDLVHLNKEQAYAQAKVLHRALQRRSSLVLKAKEKDPYLFFPKEYVVQRGKNVGKVKLKLNPNSSRNKQLSNLVELMRHLNDPRTKVKYQQEQFNNFNNRIESLGLRVSKRDYRRLWKIYKKVLETEGWFEQTKGGSDILQQMIVERMKEKGGIDEIVHEIEERLNKLYENMQK